MERNVRVEIKVVTPLAEHRERWDSRAQCWVHHVHPARVWYRVIETGESGYGHLYADIDDGVHDATIERDMIKIQGVFPLY